ncbi:hypothetical protein HanXRQr2_Chr17g0819121 [Helianthus annuus]|uniref:Uncharacterized protein n=1 Tax=Helianthus annuus TaxID=4232 RepID=A0A9K3DJQ2_HELAN|nr:hypothetical protein HanXRQr2_Chr17g0819121 [Helianthus annuus]
MRLAAMDTPYQIYACSTRFVDVQAMRVISSRYSFNQVLRVIGWPLLSIT